MIESFKKELKLSICRCCIAALLCGCGGLPVPSDFSWYEYNQTETESEAYTESCDTDVSAEAADAASDERTADAENGGGIEETSQESAVEEENAGFLMEEAGHFAYDSLDEVQKIWYRDIEKALGGMEKEVRLSWDGVGGVLDETDIDTIFQCVIIDHPEIFYVDGYSYNKYSVGDKIVSVRFSGTYNCDEAAAAEKALQINAAAENILANAPQNGSEYEKVKYVYENIVLNTDYDLDSEDNQNIYSVLVNHKSVCLGYAKATQYLLLKLGIECTLVQGTVEEGEAHAWNLVKVDGDYYYVDTTWGDASYQDAGSNSIWYYNSSINYDYLCVTTSQLLRTHTPGGYVELPVCTATAANYYVMEDALFYEYDEDRLRELFERAIAEGKNDVTVKCADGECFQEMKERLIDAQEIFNCIPGDIKEITYANNSSQLSLTFWISQ
ncbi:MAG: hypothetical protein LUG83_11675 [Lachnospiraceae bacterium]|nr:hypothetical protein [Lachnospiraceae bacterium]